MENLSKWFTPTPDRLKLDSDWSVRNHHEISQNNADTSIVLYWHMEAVLLHCLMLNLHCISDCQIQHYSVPHLVSKCVIEGLKGCPAPQYAIQCHTASKRHPELLNATQQHFLHSTLQLCSSMCFVIHAILHTQLKPDIQHVPLTHVDIDTITDVWEKQIKPKWLSHMDLSLPNNAILLLKWM